ncbi:MAG: hypothetical protein WCG80_18000 [Spirochaetales bacterium]
MTRRDAIRRATLISGLVLTGGGAVLLFITQNVLESVVKWSPTALVLLGAYFLYRVIFLKARPGYLFSGLILVLGGTFTLLLSTGILPEGFSLKELWPVYMGIIGVSLLPYGARYRRTIRVSLFIPGLFLIFLCVAFLLFSLSVVKESLAEFVGRWWPLLLIFMGLTLLASSWLQPADPKD